MSVVIAGLDPIGGVCPGRVREGLLGPNAQEPGPRGDKHRQSYPWPLGPGSSLARASPRSLVRDTQISYLSAYAVKPAHDAEKAGSIRPISAAGVRQLEA